MGLEQREKGKYITIYDGKFCVRVPEGTEGAVTRTNKIGKVVHELFYDSCTGKLVNIRVKDSNDYGKTWEFVLLDEETNDEFILQLSYSNSYATALLKMLPNIDLTKAFTLSPSQKIVEGKTQSSLFVNQDKQPIKHHYTKDVPNGLPPMTKIMVKGKETWDDTDRLAFLFDMVNADILPKLGQDAIATSEKATSLDDIKSNQELKDAEESPF